MIAPLEPPIVDPIILSELLFAQGLAPVELAQGCVPLWAIGVAVSPFITGCGILWRALERSNQRHLDRALKDEERFDELLRRNESRWPARDSRTGR